MGLGVYYQEGKYIDYTPGSSTPAGTVVVLGSIIGVAVRNIAANEKGALCISGTFVFDKVSGGDIAVGAMVYWDAGNAVATGSASGNTAIGYAVEASGTALTTVKVRTHL